MTKSELKLELEQALGLAKTAAGFLPPPFGGAVRIVASVLLQVVDNTDLLDAVWDATHRTGVPLVPVPNVAKVEVPDEVLAMLPSGPPGGGELPQPDNQTRTPADVGSGHGTIPFWK